MKKLFVILAMFVMLTPSVHAAEPDVESVLRAILNRLAELQTEVIAVPGEARVAGVATEAGTESVPVPQLTIVIDGAVVETHYTLFSETAMSLCEAVAYDTDNMWKKVECVFAGDLIYNDVFVAG